MIQRYPLQKEQQKKPTFKMINLRNKNMSRHEDGPVLYVMMFFEFPVKKSTILIKIFSTLQKTNLGLKAKWRTQTIKYN